jgi:outer membrane lipoprotein SlyB
MMLVRLSFATAAVAFAAGCVSVSPPDNTYAFRPGTGTVENVHPARVAIPGGTAPSTPLRQLAEPRYIDGYQLSLRMDDGTLQAITQDSDAFHSGDRVQVTPQGRIHKLRVAAASAAAAPVAARPGGATVEAVAAASASSAAGGSAPAEQLTLHMDDGTTQLLTVQGATFQPGERVSVSADGRVLRP